MGKLFFNGILPSSQKVLFWREGVWGHYAPLGAFDRGATFGKGSQIPGWPGVFGAQKGGFLGYFSQFWGTKRERRVVRVGDS